MSERKERLAYRRRNLLARRSAPLYEAANNKLMENSHKRDDWENMSDDELMELLKSEIDEIDGVLAAPLPPNAFKRELAKELGDAINGLRFLAVKYGVIDLD